jgi:hypothetical protein
VWARATRTHTFADPVIQVDDLLKGRGRLRGSITACRFWLTVILESIAAGEEILFDADGDVRHL